MPFGTVCETVTITKPKRYSYTYIDHNKYSHDIGQRQKRRILSGPSGVSSKVGRRASLPPKTEKLSSFVERNAALGNRSKGIQHKE